MTNQTSTRSSNDVIFRGLAEAASFGDLDDGPTRSVLSAVSDCPMNGDRHLDEPNCRKNRPKRSSEKAKLSDVGADNLKISITCIFANLFVRRGQTIHVAVFSKAALRLPTLPSRSMTDA
ncbi:MAG: hypothetical protein JNL96_18505 [Planctomycetaceae bacterium]|nr:hypothetical protein [Planctomycetaceae bacterium]